MRMRDGSPYKENAIEIFKFSKEDRDQGIPFDVVNVALLKKNVGFVEKKNSFPSNCILKDLFEFDLKLPGLDAKVTATNSEQRSLLVLSHTF